RLGAFAVDASRFIDKRVLLTGESKVLEAENGRQCLLDTLRLLIRICPNLSIALPDTVGDLLDEVGLLAKQLTDGRDVEFLAEKSDRAGFDAILSIGTLARPELPWTVINSN